MQLTLIIYCTLLFCLEFSASIPHDFDPQKHEGKDMIRPPYEALNQARPIHYRPWNQQANNKGSYYPAQRQNFDFPNTNYGGLNDFQGYVPNSAQQIQQGQIPEGYPAQQRFPGYIEHSLPNYRNYFERPNFNDQIESNQKILGNSMPRQQSNLPRQYGYPTQLRDNLLTDGMKWPVLPQQEKQDVRNPITQNGIPKLPLNINNIRINPHKVNVPVVPNREIHRGPENVFIGPEKQYIYPKNIEQSYDVKESPIMSSLLLNNRQFVNKPEVVTPITNTVAGSFVPPIPSRPSRDTITSKLPNHKILPRVEIKEFETPPIPSVKFEDRHFASASNPVETRFIRPPNYKVQQLISDPNIRNVLSTTKHKKRYLVIYPNGTVGHIDRLETFAQSNPDYVLIHAGDIITNPTPKQQKVQESKLRKVPTRESIANKDKNVFKDVPIVNITSPTQKSVSTITVTNNTQSKSPEWIPLTKQSTNIILSKPTRNITDLVLNSSLSDTVPPKNFKTINVILGTSQNKTFLVHNNTANEDLNKDHVNTINLNNTNILLASKSNVSNFTVTEVGLKEKVKLTSLQKQKPIINYDTNITRDTSIDSSAPDQELIDVYGKNMTESEITSSTDINSNTTTMDVLADIPSKNNHLSVGKVIAISVDTENPTISTSLPILQKPILGDAKHNNELPINASISMQTSQNLEILDNTPEPSPVIFSNMTSNFEPYTQIDALVEKVTPTLLPKPKPIIIYGANITRDLYTDSSTSEQEPIEVNEKNETEKDIKNPMENYTNVNKLDVIANKSSEDNSLQKNQTAFETLPILPFPLNANKKNELPISTNTSRQTSEEPEMPAQSSLILTNVPSEGNLSPPQTVEPHTDVNKVIVSPAKDINFKQTENPKIIEDSIASPSVVIPNVTTEDIGNAIRIMPLSALNRTVAPSIEDVNPRETENRKIPENSISTSVVLSNPTAEESLNNQVLKSPLDAKQKTEPLIETSNTKQSLETPKISETPKTTNVSTTGNSPKNSTDMPPKPEKKEGLKIPEGDLDISKIKSNEKPDIWIRTVDGNILDKLTDHTKDYDVVYFFQIHSQPKIENETTRTIYPNGTIVEETTKSVWENEEGPPIVTKSMKFINSEDNLNKQT